MSPLTFPKRTICTVLLLSLGQVANAFHPVVSPTTISSIRHYQQHSLTQMSLTNENDTVNVDNTPQNNVFSRRDALVKGAFFSFVVATSQSANAFDNKISNKYDDRPKRKGPQPKDLGIATRKDMIGEEYQGLKPCGPAPNCFCSTDSIEDDPEHNIPAWTWPADVKSKEEAFIQLQDVVNSYKPGQGNIDGGGFKIIKFDSSSGYLYAQFEALKNGYIDDVEFAAMGSDNIVQVRSSSRVGYLDFGVNAKRLNYIAKGLRAKGWDATGVDFKVHPDYAMQNQVQ